MRGGGARSGGYGTLYGKPVTAEAFAAAQRALKPDGVLVVVDDERRPIGIFAERDAANPRGENCRRA